MGLVAGLDGCPSGWIVAARQDDDAPELHFARSFDEVIERFASASVLAVDIPIGLPVAEARRADIAARAFVGPRRSSVFPAPPHPVLDATGYEEALAIARSVSGHGLSRQAWALVPKIREVARFSDDPRVFEVHPEVSFRALAPEPLQTSKKTWNGLEERRRLLAAAGLQAPQDLGEAGDHGAPDDVLDALAACWTASRIARGEAKRLPADPTNRLPTIWY